MVNVDETQNNSILVGIFLILYVYYSLGFKQISATQSEAPEIPPVLERHISNLSPDDKISRKTELLCLAIHDLKNVF